MKKDFALYRRQLQVWRELDAYSRMTGSHPEVVAEALKRLSQEGKPDCSSSATVHRFRQILDAVARERAAFLGIRENGLPSTLPGKNGMLPPPMGT